jgi:hypothetical protein
MLFVFDTEGYYSFWMKGMKFPLDFVWINNDKVVQIDKKVSPPLGKSPIITVNPNFKVDKVLEINAGEVEANNIKVGDKIEFYY